MKKFTFLFVALVASAAMFAENPVITNDSLWNEFKVYFAQYYPEGSVDPVAAKAACGWPRDANQTIDNAMSFWPSGVDANANILTNENSWYKWLGDFILEVATAKGVAITTEAQWRSNLWAFLNQKQRTSWPASADFSDGSADPAIWNELYYAQPAKPAVPSAVENTTVAVKAQKVMIDGQVYMVREGKTFNMLGQEVK